VLRVAVQGLYDENSVKIGTWVAGPSGEKDAAGNLLPGEVYDIHKYGRRKVQGGTGTVWMCSCPRGNLYPVELCRHLRRIIDFANEGKIPPQLKLTAEGKRAAARCGCIKAANAGKAPPQKKQSWQRPGARRR
jgi:hypothetical protein